ncbi:unnamed protein product [Arabis nemorensis]|uniref:Uncharacterized protein n=1 Tax=Arabis nemorensis TaxID=586526 RepID=A0A565CN26_9BRAS|nr:unnamed protein product [Arabis nemorensis]
MGEIGAKRWNFGANDAVENLAREMCVISSTSSLIISTAMTANQSSLSDTATPRPPLFPYHG